MTRSNRLDFATRCVHAGQAPDPTTGAVMMPIYATSTFVQESPGVHKGYDYGRTKNPTRMAFERCIADLEGGTAAFAFASGLAAIAAVLECLDHGAHIVAVDAPAIRARTQAFLRPAGELRRPVGRSRAGNCNPSRDASRLGRDADQSAAQARGPRARGVHRALARHLDRRG